MLNNNLRFLKKIHLQVCLIYTFKIFKTSLQENRIIYNFEQCVFATNMNQSFNFLKLQVKFQSSLQEKQKLFERIENLVLCKIFTFEQFLYLLNE